MKKLSVVISILFISFAFLNEGSFAQNLSKGFIVSIGGGASFPVGEFHDYHIARYEIGVKGGYQFDNNFASGIKVDYSHFSNSYLPSVIISGGNSNVISISAFVMTGNLKRSVKLNPYFLLGAGVYLKNTTSANTTFGYFEGSGFDPYFGVDIGAGLSYRASSKASLFIEPKYAGTFENPNIIFLSVKVGVLFNL